MHAILYVCLPRSQARSSVQARKKVCDYLTEEGFDTQLRFSGRCDYFKVGGLWSGQLTRLRLDREQPTKARKFWRLHGKATSEDEVAEAFKECFPDHRGPVPLSREEVPQYGYPDDAQVMGESLFRYLKKGFSEDVTLSWEMDDPNVIFTDEIDRSEWPKTAEEAAKFWVVIIDYHF